jgi:hypothetical protein
MNCGRLVKTGQGGILWGVLLLCLAVILGGCGTKEPALSPQAQALKKDLVGMLDNLTAQLLEPVSQQDWSAVGHILPTAYGNMQKQATLAPERIVVLDRDGITQARFPSEGEGTFDFSNYTPARIVFREKRTVQATLYFQGKKIFVVLAPLLQKKNLVGAVTLAFPADALERQWNISENQFLSMDLKQ